MPVYFNNTLVSDPYFNSTRLNAIYFNNSLVFSRFTSQTFSYTGGIQTFTIPVNGTYKLEVWGAQGGSITNAAGGLGGYSHGNISLSEGTVIYIVVGGAGKSPTYAETNYTHVSGGYNGGGDGISSEWTGNRIGGGGGGATHIATSNGILSSLSSNKGAVLIVAGGGGGSYRHDSVYNAGGSGGGSSGGNGIVTYEGSSGGSGGTQTSGASFGAGGTCSVTIHDIGSAGGGGGYYGGMYGYFRAAGGGSGYVGGVSGGVTTAGQRSGNGQAKITLI